MVGQVKMITKITTEQAREFSRLMAEQRDYASAPTDHDASKSAIEAMYTDMKLAPPRILHFTSPFLSVLAAGVLHSQLYSQLRSQLDIQLDIQLDSQLHSQLGSQLDSQLYSQLGSQLYSQLGSQLGSQLDSQLDSQLHSQLGSQLGSQLDSQLDSQLHSQLGSQLDSQLYSQLRSQLDIQLDIQLDSQLRSQLDIQLDSQLRSQLDIQLDSQLHSQLGSQLHSQLDSQLHSHYIVLWWGTWTCYYKFAQTLGVKFDNDKYLLLYNFVNNIHSCLPYENICIYTDKPVECHWRGTRLHNESGMAVKYADGWGWYVLNGVAMMAEYVETPADKISPETVLAETNVDVRRELLRKVGVGRMSSYGKEVDVAGNYKLLDMASIFQGVRYAPHLLMLNPSVDETWHLEGVGPECKTVEQAINWRAGDIAKLWTPDMLS